MTELRERAGFARKPLREIPVVAGTRRENFQRDEAVQRRLARLVNRAHAAFADEFKDFELRKQFGEFGNRGRHERLRAGRRTAFGRDAALQQAGRAKPLRHVGFQFRAALRAFAGNDLSGGYDGRRWVFLFPHLAKCEIENSSPPALGSYCKDANKCGNRQKSQNKQPQAEQDNCAGFRQHHASHKF